MLVQCLALAAVLGSSKVAYPDNSAYDASLASYYSAQQEAIRPACVVFPQTTGDVSDIVKTLAKEGVSDFAIRSGGHTSWAGASNLAGGVTLDLRGLNSVEVSGRRRISTRGRVAGVGVGGLTLGGGISHLSPQHGWTCDTVLNFEVVLSDGQVVEANARENADLFFALRGGGNNFGIVTRIDLQTFEQGLVWSASLMCDTSALDATVQEYIRLAASPDYDEHASFLLSFAHIGAMSMSVIADSLLYTEPIENPPIYGNLAKIPSLQSSGSLKNMSAVAADTGAMVPKGARSLYRTVTLAATEAVLHAVHEVWSDAARAITKVPGITWVISFDPLPPAFYARHAGSNALGLTGRDGKALLVALLDVRWSDAADDELVTSTAKTLFENVRMSPISKTLCFVLGFSTPATDQS
ncbi:oxidoreductase- FAD-binding [Apiospora aurea]|uniref:Oxidoreductase- FAD-binding n=1 Tax=Apiospora aurea TaxID=335848 RepID=A0ABR1QM47_9PEZI